MSDVGRVRELWRYPVKSMQGERLPRVVVGPRGIPGDRGWAVRDERAGEIRGAKKLPALMRCAARYPTVPIAGEPPPGATITLPDGSTVASDAPDAAARLSALLGRPVTLWPLQPEASTAHYRRGRPDSDDMAAELRQMFGRQEDEPLPDLSVFPPELFEYTSPLGTYFDAFPLHLLTTASLDALRADGPAARADVRRFRPNVLVHSPDERGFVEPAWCGRRLRVGTAVLQLQLATPRCVMTTLPTGELLHDPTVLRGIVRDADQCLGVYATVLTPGVVAEGDPVSLEA